MNIISVVFWASALLSCIIGVYAYVYFEPRVIMWVTERNMTNPKNFRPDYINAPINHFGHMDRLADPSDKVVVNPNSDTLYSSAWLDLSKEPIILHVPDTHGRYYTMQMIDAWTNVFAYVGRRVTGTKEGYFALVGPHWKGTLPKDIKDIRAPTNTVWLVGRTLVRDKEDIPNGIALQKQYTLIPLDQFK
jgi:hypothetical protein